MGKDLEQTGSSFGKAKNVEKLFTNNRFIEAREYGTFSKKAKSKYLKEASKIKLALPTTS